MQRLKYKYLREYLYSLLTNIQASSTPLKHVQICFTTEQCILHSSGWTSGRHPSLQNQQCGGCSEAQTY